MQKSYYSQITVSPLDKGAEKRTCRREDQGSLVGIKKQKVVCTERLSMKTAIPVPKVMMLAIFEHHLP